jgi:hypothetical protein
VTVTVPAGALSATTSMTVSVYLAGSLPKPLQSKQRGVRSLPSGITPIIEVAIDTSPPATLLKPLKLSLANPGPPAGSVYRLAGYGTNGFMDVDTVAWAAGGLNVGVATEDNNNAYANASLAIQALYGFYTVPLANAAPAPTLIAAATGPATLEAGATAQYGATETDGNGFPVLQHAFAFSVDNPAMGTIAPAGLLSAGATDTTGNVVASDTTVGSATPGKLPVHVSSARPNASGDKFLFTGTLVTSLTAQQPPAPPSGNPGPPVTSTTTAQVVQNISSAGSTDGVNYALNNDEFDNESLRTTEIKTATNLSYVAGTGGGFVVRVTQEVSTDSNGVKYQTNYGPNNGAVTLIPEIASSANNDAQLVYQEFDPGNPAFDPTTGMNTTGPTIQRNVNGDGSYTETIFNNGFMDTYQGNTDGSGVAKITGGATEYDFLPVTTSGGVTFVPINVFNVNTVTKVKTPNGAQRQVFPWYGSTVPAPIVSDSITITPASALDAKCPVSAAFTKTGKATAALTTETYSAYDFVLGQLETRTIKTFDVAGPGTVCAVLNDRIDTWYDYSGQEGNITQKRPTTATPFQTTVVTEALGQQIVAGSPSSSSRSTQATTTARASVIAALRARFAHVAVKAKIEQARRFANSTRSTRGTH